MCSVCNLSLFAVVSFYLDIKLYTTVHFLHRGEKTSATIFDFKSLTLKALADLFVLTLHIVCYTKLLFKHRKKLLEMIFF